ncbi:perlucin-like [Mercenaria mercenaria]|uniref:perlucin-like n=1 Tax=Mercenaria mercenaria TaxID=6596 RepID=UPI00234F760C|nr:perlucin-like [Mercenaria mercenaria]
MVKHSKYDQDNVNKEEHKLHHNIHVYNSINATRKHRADLITEVTELSNKVLLLVLASFELVEGQCTDGFIKHGDSCYHFSHDTETWLDAELSCQQLYGAHLAEIEDATENNFLINEVNVLGFSFWVGGNDLQVEGEWKWFSSKTAVKYSTWHPGNPSNNGGDENCMEILDGDGKGPQKPLWNDKQCHAYQRYICEKSTTESEIVG